MAKVTMPQLGESVAEGTIGKWLKQPGDHVEKYEPLLEVITDKVNAEVPSPFAGVLKEILAEEGATVPNNAEIAIIDTGDEAAGAEAAPPVEATPAPAEATPAAAEAKSTARTRIAAPAKPGESPRSTARPAPAATAIAAPIRTLKRLRTAFTSRVPYFSGQTVERYFQLTK